MEKELLNAQLGPYAKATAKYENGKLLAGVEVEAKGLAIIGLQQAKELIPGHFDDALIDAAIEAIKALA